MDKNVPAHIALISGAFSGFGVDIGLFPLDTIKTRLQSEAGFIKSGGFSRLWSGIGPVAVGSAPGAATFFIAYETGKSKIFPKLSENQVLVHMLSASLAEVCACIVRVPVEVIKQRMQVASVGTTSAGILKLTLKNEGIYGLFRGYTTTVLREVPFSLIQMPLWEWLKVKVAQNSGQDQATPIQSSICGAFAGGFSAAITTPLDVAKTRIMLADSSSDLARKQSALLAIKLVYQERGIKGLFAGVVPRVAWISIGGAIFLGIYDFSVSMLR